MANIVMSHVSLCPVIKTTTYFPVFVMIAAIMFAAFTRCITRWFIQGAVVRLCLMMYSVITVQHCVYDVQSCIIQGSSTILPFLLCKLILMLRMKNIKFSCMVISSRQRIVFTVEPVKDGRSRCRSFRYPHTIRFRSLACLYFNYSLKINTNVIVLQAKLPAISIDFGWFHHSAGKIHSCGLLCVQYK